MKKPKLESNPSANSNDFDIYHLSSDKEIENFGKHFENALSNEIYRKTPWVQNGEIYYTEHKSDSALSLMFYVDKNTKKASNFVLKRNGKPTSSSIDQIQDALIKQGLCSRE